jgi:polyisoprenyl-teichoic acid--peptidoglycan teichoic acid transferase
MQPNRGPTQPPRQEIGDFQSIRVIGRQPPRPPARRRPGCCTCWVLLLPVLAGLILLVVYLLAPLRTNLLVLGIDRVPDGTALGRSDTMILVSVNPLLPEVNLFSIPRDLWVNIPGVGENRINTAHFFAEANIPGSGPEAALETVNLNFKLQVPYYVRFRFDAFLGIVDALGGVTVNLPEDMAGLPAGTHHLDGTQALAFVRDRKGADDFFRMENTQFMLRAVARQALQPASWPRLPAVAAAGLRSIDTNLPVWQWPRLGVAFVRASLTGFNSHTVSREMATPFTTDEGAQVLLPNWDLILPAVSAVIK